MNEILFKVLHADGRPFHGGLGAWPLPTGGQPGGWRRVAGELRPCRNGLHLCRPRDLPDWLGPTLWLAEAGEERIVAGNKIVAREARLLRRVEAWDDRAARVFAADCAERALLREREAGREPDRRSWDAVRVARAFADGEASPGELAAARAAAYAADDDAAAYAAAWAAVGAARDSAWDAAGAAVAPTRHGERAWQVSRLMSLLGFPLLAGAKETP